MDNDTDLALSEINGGSTSSLVKQIMEIREHTISRKRMEEWAKRLRFLDISGVGDGERRRGSVNSQSDDLPERVLPLRINEQGKRVAISWRWMVDIPLGQGPATYRYLVRKPGGQLQRSTVPDLLFDRAIKFAQEHEIDRLWIDKECINQNNETDKTTGTQAMDIVYRESTLSLGILWVVVQSQTQLDCLSKLLSERIPHKGSEEPRLVGWGPVSGILDVLRLILSDERWERTWIFQEDHCASSRMHLLVRHAPLLRKDRKIFGDIPGELQIRCDKFRRAATEFCVACDEAGEYVADILAKVRQYNIWNKSYGVGTDSGPGDSQGSAYDDGLPRLPASSLSILLDIKERKNAKVEDRLTIFANCCQYLARLDVRPLTKARYGLSACILCLYLLNGEIFSGLSQRSQDSENILNCSVYDFLERISFKFDPPMRDFRLSYIDRHCRFHSVKLTPEGVETVGWLWEIGEEIAFTSQNRRDIRHHLEYRSLSSSRPWGLRLLRNRLTKLGHWQLSEYLERDNDGPSQQFIEGMINAVVDGLLQNKTLRLATIYRNSRHLGIFIMDSNDIEPPKPTIAFTSFSSKEQKFVSIEVKRGRTLAGGRQALRARSWINGVWFSSRKYMKTCVFPWPFE
ncbi:MAG: hypothetical protein M1839_001749 [Geoglossum umbratile]|nr:MAG: hypothetical protein M1839_001749 [Geoglossum umbratile]